jgi:hypothetical protein
MLTDDGKHLYVSWDEYHMLTSAWRSRCMHRAGSSTRSCAWRVAACGPGDVLSRVFDKPLAIMSTSSYRAEAGTIQGRLDMAKYITMPKGELAGRVLLVDDLADSGRDAARRGRPPARHAVDQELRSAVLWVKGVSSYTPDYFVETLPTSPWIHQPFEEYDGPAPEGLEVLWPRSSTAV